MITLLDFLHYSVDKDHLRHNVSKVKAKRCSRLCKLCCTLNTLSCVPTIGLLKYYLVVSRFSLERRWSSRTFRYGYLVTTSPQSSTPPSAASPLRLDYRLRVLPTLMVWRAVCTRPGNVFTAACWSAITSDSNFIQASFSLQSELGPFLGICSTSRSCLPLLTAIVVRV